ncbi:transferrin-binding protein-like solute binding protein [Novosphingobium sp. MW5]|nr:transferrin-binding protein-like solute binding protein [Novosphingobium sp. MW5]
MAAFGHGCQPDDADVLSVWRAYGCGQYAPYGFCNLSGHGNGPGDDRGPGFPDRSSFAGTATLAADFAANTLSTSLNLGFHGTYSGNATIAADQFNGPLTATYANFVTGQFTGGFFGPNAAEAGYTFYFRYFNPDPYAGASIGWMNRYFSGVVAAKKD